jgi:magnesium transporter
MYRAVFLSNKNQPILLSDIDTILRHLQEPEGFLWVSLEQASESEIDLILNQTFHFHPLAIEDCLSPGYQSSKLDDFSDYVFLIAHAIIAKPNFEDLETLELDFFLGENFLVTCFTDHSMPPVQKTWELLAKDTRIARNGPDFLCHTLLDCLVDDYMPLIDHMENEVEWLEDSVLEKPDPKTLAKLLSLKHTIMSLRRIVAPQREVINRLSRDEFTQIDPQSLIYFRDIYDHLVRIQDLADTLRDIVSGTMDIYLNSTSLRLNEIMKALTIVSTIFLPLSFIAGLFGMNFRVIPGADHPLGFYLTCVASVLLGLGMLIYFRRRKWF